jgi:hypothetical protein
VYVSIEALKLFAKVFVVFFGHGLPPFTRSTAIRIELEASDFASAIDPPLLVWLIASQKIVFFELRGE